MTTATVGFEDSAVLERIQSWWLSHLIHEFSGPLFAARGYLRLAAEEAGADPADPLARHIAAALESVGKLAELAQELKSFPASESFTFEAFSVRDLLHEVAVEIGALGGKVRLEEDHANGDFTVIGDRKKLESAVRTLLAESVKFTGGEGIVRIAGREQDEKITFQFWAIGAGAARDRALPSISFANGICRLHGGALSVSRVSESVGLVALELPVVRPREC